MLELYVPLAALLAIPLTWFIAKKAGRTEGYKEGQQAGFQEGRLIGFVDGLTKSTRQGRGVEL